jgi:hypothetical protein
MFLLLVSLGIGKATPVDATTFDSVIESTPITFVFFSSRKVRELRRILQFFDKIAEKYQPSIGVLIVNADSSPGLADRFSITATPHLSLFRKGRLISHYFDAFEYPQLTSFCDGVLNATVAVLNSSFDVFEFQDIKPLNLLVSGEGRKGEAEAALASFGGAVAIGYLADQSVIKELEVPALLLSRPEEDVSEELASVEDVYARLFTPFTHVKDAAVMGRSATQHCLQVVLDERDPLQLKLVIDRLRLVDAAFGTNISYLYCDWFTCPSIVEAVGLASFQSPLFVLKTEGNEGFSLEPFRKRSTQADDIVNWLKRLLLHEVVPSGKDVVEIPRLLAKDFVTVALNPKVDVVLLVATPDMPSYDESQQNVRMLIECFKDIPTVKFYEFNPVTEELPGLELQRSDRPLLSVWPASEEHHGSTFGAYLSIPLVLDQLLTLIATQVSDSELGKMAAIIQTFLEREL